MAAIFCFYIVPAFFGGLLIQAEETCGLFQYFDLTVFFPGSNRILSVEPWLASWMPTLWWSFAFIEVLSFGLVTVASYLIMRLIKESSALFALAFLIVIGVLFANWGYAYIFSTVEPYTRPLSMFVIAAALMSSEWQTRAYRWLALMAGSVLLFLAVGINPIIGIFGCFLLGLVFLDRAADELRRGRKLPGPTTILRVLRLNREIITVLAVLLVSAVFFQWFQARYEVLYPNSVASNYSVGGYALFQPSLHNTVTSLKYLAVFFAQGLIVPSAARSLLLGLMVLPFIQLALIWRLRRTSENAGVVRLVRMALILYLASLLTICVVSQISHVLLVDNLVRGRYFTIPYFGCAGSAVATLTGLFRIGLDKPRRSVPVWTARYERHGAGGVIGLAALLIFVAHLALGERPAFAEQHFESEGLTPAEAEKLALVQEENGLVETLKASGVTAVVGDYWSVWNVGFDLNRDSTSSGPAVTPISIRTEAFSLAAFKPMLASLNATGHIDFACIGIVNLALADALPCADFAHRYAGVGAFPSGVLTPLRGEQLGKYLVKYYRLSVTAEAPQACADGDMTFRGQRNEQPVGVPIGYQLRKDGFVYISGRAFEGAPIRVAVKTAHDHLTFDTSAGSRSDIALDGERLKVSRATACSILIERQGNTLLGSDSWSVSLDHVTPLAPPAGQCPGEIAEDTRLQFVSAAVAAPACRAGQFLQAGWGPAEPTGTWSTSGIAQLMLPTRGFEPGELRLDFDASSYSGMGFYNKPQTIDVRIGGKMLAAWHFGPARGAASPITLAANDWTPGQPIALTFDADPPYNPSVLGIAPDNRNLGLFLRSLVVHASSH